MTDRDIDDLIEEGMKSFEEDLSELVSVPSVGQDPQYGERVRDCAELVARILGEMGAEAELVETPGHPLVLGDLSNFDGATTIGIYGHYDVQPISSPGGWRSDPFSLHKDDGKYYGRGASDDKGNLLTALKAAEIALKRGLRLNFQFILEGEEESGSTNFEEGIERGRDLLNPDLIVVADGGWISRDNPSIEYGLRGLLYMHWNLKTADKNAHSGATGGAARNPLLELFEAAASCIDARTGQIKIPGVREDLRDLEPEEVEYWEGSGFDVGEFKDSYRLKGLRFEDRDRVLRSIWAEPTFEVHGCVGGHMERDGETTILPAEGQLLVSMRLVPDQSPERVFERVREYISEVNPDIEVRKVGEADPYLADPESPRVEAAVRALEETFHSRASRIRSGGSIGALPAMERVLGDPEIIIMAFGLPEDGAHGPNEHFSEEQARKGMEAYWRYFELLEGGAI